MRIIRTVISGSFHRNPEELKLIYEELHLANCQILSPFSASFENIEKEFVTTKNERTLTPFELERRHLTAIAHADFVWLHCPDGYIRVSTALEIGFAYAREIPIFTSTLPKEGVFKGFVSKYVSVFEALKKEDIL